MSRIKARESAFTLIFELDFSLPVASADELLATAEKIFANALTYRTEDPEDELFIEDDPYVRDCFYGVAANLPDIDARISRRAEGWTIARVSRVSLAVMRLAAYEMTIAGLPYAVAINEAIEISKKYDDDAAAGFINGVLNAVAVDAELKE
jgi:N utilization substance protein B